MTRGMRTSLARTGHVTETIWLAVGVLLTGLGSEGCGEDGDSAPRFVLANASLTILSTVALNAATEADLGYDLRVTMFGGTSGASPNCLPREITVTVNGRSLLSGERDPDPCVQVASSRFGPFLKNDPVSVGVEYQDQTAVAVFEDVFPGTGVATEVTTAVAGSEVDLMEPQRLRGKVAGPAVFFVAAGGVLSYSSERTVRDGQTVRVTTPAREGQVTLFAGIGVNTVPTTLLRCQGVLSCDGLAAATLGPIRLTLTAPR
jgi:hypothetical protein